MDDRYFFAVVIYLFITIGVSGFLPDSFYSGTQHDNLNNDDFRESFSGDIDSVDDLGGQLSFFSKIITFIFVTWTIDGIPLIFAIIILFLNFLTITIGSIYIYDKIRAIGS